MQPTKPTRRLFETKVFLRFWLFISIGDQCLVTAGGYDKSFQTDRASVECYDPEREMWSFVSEMETPRSGLVLATVDHYLYAVGGRSRSHHYYNMAER